MKPVDICSSRSVVRALAVPVKDADRFGLDSGQVKRPPELGGGLVANIEVFHQLHCLVRSCQLNAKVDMTEF